MIRLLNEALATEIVCVLRYKRHYYMERHVHHHRVQRVPHVVGHLRGDLAEGRELGGVLDQRLEGAGRDGDGLQVPQEEDGSVADVAFDSLTNASPRRIDPVTASIWAGPILATTGRLPQFHSRCLPELGGSRIGSGREKITR